MSLVLSVHDGWWLRWQVPLKVYPQSAGATSICESHECSLSLCTYSGFLFKMLHFSCTNSIILCLIPVNPANLLKIRCPILLSKHFSSKLSKICWLLFPKILIFYAVSANSVNLLVTRFHYLVSSMLHHGTAHQWYC